MKQYKLSFSKECRGISCYRRLLVFLTLFTLFFAGNVQAQCDQIAFNFEQYEPCRFRVTYDNSTECYTQLRLSLADGTFSNWSVIPNSGFIVEVISPSELWITHTGGFLPLGFQVPLLFTLPFDLNTSINIAYLNDCAQVGCDILGGIPIESCPDPQNASVVGVKYKECGFLPYISQTPLSGWTIELLDAEGTIIGEQVTDVDGSYVFYDLKAGSYVVRETQQPGWTARVPASGETAIDLMASQQRIVNFGNCPPVSPPCNCPAGSQQGGNAVVNGNFSGSGGFTSSYALNNTPTLQPGQYWIGSNPSQINAGFAACGDHTSGTGNMMVVNGAANQNTTIWSQTFSVTPNTTYKFETWITSLSSASPAYVGTILMVGNNQYGGFAIFAPVTTCSWAHLCNEWYNFDATTVTISLINSNSATTGNDFALDDISFRKCVPPHGDVTGVVYRECSSLLYADQPLLSGWMVQLLDTMGNLVSEQVTGSDGAYAFSELPPGIYIVRVQLPGGGWTSNVPATGMTAIELDAGESLVANFGMCLDCTPCPPPTDLEAIDVGSTSATIKLATSSCSDRTCWWWDNEDGTPGGYFTYTDASVTSIVIDDLVPGTTYNVWAFSLCDSIMSESSDTIRIVYPCFGGYTSCPGNLLSNGSFEGPFSSGLPNAADQIGLCPGWQQSTNGSGVSSIGDWYTGFYQLPGTWPGYYNDVPNQQYTFFQASCGYRYAGFALNTCEGISTPLTASVAPGTGYNIGFWWSPKEPVTSNFTFLAILSNANCTVNTANGGTACTHQCAGDFHIPVTATPANIPGTWYFHSYTGNAPASFTQLTFAAKSGGPIVNNYIFVDEVCVREVFQICHVDKPRITQNSGQPNAFLGEADLGAGSTLISAVWDFGDGTKDSSCCLGSVIHDFAPGSYEVCLEVTAMDTSGMTCSNRTCIPVVIAQSGGKCDHVAAFLQKSTLGDCCYDLKINNIEPNCFTQIDVTLSSGSFINSIFGPGWNISLNGNMISLTPTAGGFIALGQDLPVTICDPGGTEPYTLDVDFVYAGGVCHRTFNYGCYPVVGNCCTDFNLFQTLASQVNTNEQYGDCSISVNGTALNDCMRIVWDWGDGIIEGPYTDNTPITHNYTGSGPHTVCYTVQEVDAAGQICWIWQKCLDLPVHCNDTCQCLGFTNMQFTFGVTPPIPPVPVDCENGTPVSLGCIANDAVYNLEGNFGCSNECTSSIQYQFFDLNNTPLLNGLATYDLALHQFNLNPGFKFPPGSYQLVLTGLCGVNDTCICHLNFTIEACNCCSADYNAFCNTVDIGTTIVPLPNFCKATLDIGFLPCQRIDWVNWGDGQIDFGPFTTGAAPMHVYTQNGPFTVTFLATEFDAANGVVCYQKIFSQTIPMLCVPDCHCGIYDMEIRLGGALNQPVVCGQTINLGLNQGFAFYPKFQCQGNDCGPTAQVGWTLTGPGTNLSGTETTTPGAIFTILPVNPGQFTTPGTYTLTMTGHCGSNLCPCVITFNVLDPCCTDQAAFLVTAAAVQTFGTLGTCTLSFLAQGLNDCMRIRYDWGDNTSSGPFADNVPVTHTYSGTNTYNVCYTIEEVDFFGNVCWTYQSCEQVYVICNDCVCGTFSEMFARPSVGAQSIALDCGQSYAFGCPNPGFSIPITGKFECQGGNCPPTSQITWTLTQPSGNNITGTIGAGPYFYLPILPHQYGVPGNYTLTLVGNCGGQPCSPCIIKFSVNCPDPCPCDATQLQADVNQGFAKILYNSSCKGCFSPIALNDCDMVNWSVNGGPVIGMTNGNGTFCHTFSGAGTHFITMTVIRKKGDGSFCAQASVTKSVTITCFSWPDCGGQIIANPRMSIGAVAGGLNSGGASLGWMGLTGNPVVVEGASGSLDAWTIDIGGKLDTSDVLSQLEPICLKKDTGMLSFRVTRPLNASHISFGCNLSVQLFRGSAFVLEYPNWNPIRCLKLASIELAPLDTGWVDVQVPYDITAWNVVDTCGDEPYGVYVRPVIYVNNALSSDQGGASTRSSVQIDNFCLDGTLVAVHNPVQKLALRIFPNPNPGTFTVQLPEAATPEMAFRIISLTGQLLREQSTQTGSAMQTVQAGDLPAGLYFLQVVEDGSVLAVEKFVKQ